MSNKTELKVWREYDQRGWICWNAGFGITSKTLKFFEKTFEKHLTKLFLSDIMKSQERKDGGLFERT